MAERPRHTTRRVTLESELALARETLRRAQATARSGQPFASTRLMRAILDAIEADLGRALAAIRG